jgi:hypothetical protein
VGRPIPPPSIPPSLPLSLPPFRCPCAGCALSGGDGQGGTYPQSRNLREMKPLRAIGNVDSPCYPSQGRVSATEGRQKLDCGRNR